MKNNTTATTTTTTSTATPSPNNSTDSSSNHHIILNGITTTSSMPFMNMTMCMDSSHSSISSSSSASVQSMQATGAAFGGGGGDNHQLMEYPFSMLSNNSHIPYDMPACLTQVGGGHGMVEDGFYGEDYNNNGTVLEGEDSRIMGLERDLCLPPLESRSMEEKHNSTGVAIDHVRSHINNNNNHFNNGCFNHTDHHHHHHQDLVGFGNNNNNHHHGQSGENLRMGEWDLEGLMQDISSFPFLDFQVE